MAAGTSDYPNPNPYPITNAVLAAMTTAEKAKNTALVNSYNNTAQDPWDYNTGFKVTVTGNGTPFGHDSVPA